MNIAVDTMDTLSVYIPPSLLLAVAD